MCFIYTTNITTTYILFFCAWHFFSVLISSYCCFPFIPSTFRQKHNNTRVKRREKKQTSLISILLLPQSYIFATVSFRVVLFCTKTLFFVVVVTCVMIIIWKKNSMFVCGCYLAKKYKERWGGGMFIKYKQESKLIRVTFLHTHSLFFLKVIYWGHVRWQLFAFKTWAANSSNVYKFTYRQKLSKSTLHSIDKLLT